MKHTNIAAMLGWENTEDLNEDFFLQPEEAATIDTALGSIQTLTIAANTANENLVAANATIGEHAATIAGMSTAAEASTSKITELEAEIAVLNGKASGSGSKLTGSGDDITETGTKLPRYDSADHPANVAANRFVAKPKK